MRVKDVFDLKDYEDFYYSITINDLLIVFDLRERVLTVLASIFLTYKIESYTVDFNDYTVSIRIITSM